MIKDIDQLRQQIIDLVGDYAGKAFGSKKSFIPIKDHVPVSGKLIGIGEIQYAIEACLDGWFTHGRFAELFENKFSDFMEQRFCTLTNSGCNKFLILNA